MILSTSAESTQNARQLHIHLGKFALSSALNRHRTTRSDAIGIASRQAVIISGCVLCIHAGLVRVNASVHADSCADHDGQIAAPAYIQVTKDARVYSPVSWLQISQNLTRALLWSTSHGSRGKRCPQHIKAARTGWSLIRG